MKSPRFQTMSVRQPKKNVLKRKDLEVLKKTRIAKTRLIKAAVNAKDVSIIKMV